MQMSYSTFLQWILISAYLGSHSSRTFAYSTESTHDIDMLSNGTDTTMFSNLENTNGSVLVPGNETSLLQNNVTSNHTSPYEPPVEIVVLLSMFYGAISLVAVLGNGMVILIVLTSRRMQTVTNYFIANLALADVVIGLFSIPFQFQAALLQRWNLPDFMCPFCPFFQNVSVNASIFTLTAIAVDRYKAIIYPLSNHASKQRTKIILAAIWAGAIILAIPQAVAFGVVIMDGSIPQCLPKNINLTVFIWYMHFLCFVQYFVPLILISFAYIRIAVVLWGSKIPGAAQDQRDQIVLKNKKKVVKVLMMVVVLFTLAWLPLQGYYVAQSIFPEVNTYKYINILWFCAHWLAMSNSCYNPFIYLICHEKFQREFRNRFKCCFKKAPSQFNNDPPLDPNRSIAYTAANGSNHLMRANSHFGGPKQRQNRLLPPDRSPQYKHQKTGTNASHLSPSPKTSNTQSTSLMGHTRNNTQFTDETTKALVEREQDVMEMTPFISSSNTENGMNDI